MSRQSIAELERNHCVTAGAGAGKTSCLVQAYLGLLAGAERRAALDPRQVVAITFTEKAAAEMRGRVMDQVAIRAAGEGGRWSELLGLLEWAPISTIHGFCATLLREHGAMLGLDPDFGILDGDGFDELLGQASDELLRQAMQDRDPALGRLLQHFGLTGEHGLEGMLGRLFRDLATMGLGAAQARVATAKAHAALLDNAAGQPARMDQAAQTLAQCQAAFSAKDQKAKYAANVANFLEQWPELGQKLAQNPLDTAAAKLAGELLGPNMGGSDALKQARLAVKDAAAKICEAAQTPEAAALSDDLLVLLERLERAVTQECVRLAVLSFDDLLLGALRLLERHPQVLADLRGRFRAVLVDEFQDVNPVQGRLVRLLCGLEHGDGDYDVDAPLLLVVGDRKQSIYAFRGADVSFFGQTMATFERGDIGVLAALGRNFRSDPRLVEFFNRLFEIVFAQRKHGEHAPEVYVDFRADDRQRPGKTAADFPDGPVLELIAPADGGQDDIDAAKRRALEAQALARHLAHLIDSGQFQPGQMAILLRRLTQVRVYEEALRRAGVDFYTVRGKGFYGCLEIGDVLMAMRAVLWPDDDLAVAALLRSPLVGLSDESLLALCHPRADAAFSPAQALAQGVELPAWRDPDQSARLTMARELLAGLAPLARRMQPAELITAIIERTDYLAVLAALPDGRQKTANLRKLIEEAREALRDSDLSVEEYARGLDDKLAAEADDPQAPLLGAAAPVVQIMTIHQAKGLQFPLVALADLAARPVSGKGMPGPGPDGAISLSPIDFATGERIKTALRQRLAERRRAIEEAESARLFYVACTRASQRLVLCLGAGKRQGQWAKWAEEFIVADPEASLVTAEDAANGDHLANEPPALAWPDCLPPEPGPLADQGRALAERCLGQRLPGPALVRVSVSAMEDWLDCPRRFFLTQRLGLDTALLDLPAEEAGQGGVAQAVELGSMVHGLMELADLRAGAAGLDAAAQRLLETKSVDGALAAQAVAVARRFWQTPLAETLAELPAKAVFREQPFLLSLPGEPGGPALELRGEFDLLAAMADGRWLIADYKVSRRLDPAKYRTQMLLYATALWRGGRERGMAPPCAVLVHLNQEQAALHPLEFAPAELDHAVMTLQSAAAGIAAQGRARRLAQVEPSPACRRDGCVLAALCPGN